MGLPYGAVGFPIIADSVEVPDVIEWSFTPDPGLKDYSSSGTGGMKARAKSVRDFKGSFKYLPPDDATELPFKAGQTIDDLQLFYSATEKYNGPAILGEVEVKINNNTGDIIEVTVNFMCNNAAGADKSTVWAGLFDNT